MKTISSVKLPNKEEKNQMIKQLFLLGGLLINLGFAETLNDKDLDGVPDTIDQCPNTPFLCEVDSKGCTHNILTLPFETEKENLTMTLAYGFNTNEDLIDREIQYNTRIKLSYYLNNWAYSIQTGYYTHKQDKGTLDTIIRVRKRIKLTPEYVLNIGTGLCLPTYDFRGNKMDELLYTSLHYYPTLALSFFAGYTFTRIGDQETSSVLPEPLSNANKNNGKPKETINEKIQNTHKFYFGTGYFFTHNFYINIIYNDEKNKFVSEHRVKSISSSMYYKINKKWFTTLYYKYEILDGDKHDNLLFTIGYTLW